MTRNRSLSYSSATLSSTSSVSSSRTYASIKSVSSRSSQSSSVYHYPQTWTNQETKKTKTYSLLNLLKSLFKQKQRGEPSKPMEKNLEIFHLSNGVITGHPETSFITIPSTSSRPSSSLQLRPSSSSSKTKSSSSNCPEGLYCVIEDFLTDYDLRMIEEEERAEMISRKSKQLLE